MSSDLSKKLLAAFFFLFAVLLLIGEDDNPGLIAETAENGGSDNADYARDYRGTSADDYPEEQTAYDEVDEVEDMADTEIYDDGDSDDTVYGEAASDEELIDDTQGFEPEPMDDALPIDG
ncbi:hypothetical protein GRI38_09235 [Altererythrobacter aurantiacus]|uniref:Uncharacterized protein n=1 Tax=Parapontixanthobacter aurantiacus TaxID=1463599 RepID=A0A844ZCC7_9SPHN|nr:hypothetical protein [Parapontixanthobacter aurantiacus]MXO86211.1 hypothetical protein [Parapontixanthobacter aurantiacus]